MDGIELSIDGRRASATINGIKSFLP